MTQRHVLPASPDGWQVVDPARDHVCTTTKTKEEALQRARQALGSNGGGILVVKEDDGSGQRTESVPPRSDPPGTVYDPSSI